MSKLYLSASLAALLAVAGVSNVYASAGVVEQDKPVVSEKPVSPKVSKKELSGKIAELVAKIEELQHRQSVLEEAGKEKQAQVAEQQIQESQKIVEVAKAENESGKHEVAVAAVNHGLEAAATTGILVTPGVSEEQIQQAVKDIGEAVQVVEQAQKIEDQAKIEQIAEDSVKKAQEGIQEAAAIIQKEADPVVLPKVEEIPQAQAIEHSAPEQIKKEEVLAIAAQAEKDQAAIEKQQAKIETPVENVDKLGEFQKAVKRLSKNIRNNPMTTADDREMAQQEALALVELVRAQAAIANGADKQESHIQKAEESLQKVGSLASGGEGSSGEVVH